jgi:hypothetical protein
MRAAQNFTADVPLLFYCADFFINPLTFSSNKGYSAKPFQI